MDLFEKFIVAILAVMAFLLVLLMVAACKLWLRGSTWPSMVERGMSNRIYRYEFWLDELVARVATDPALHGFLNDLRECSNAVEPLPAPLRQAAFRLAEGERKLLGLFKNAVGLGLLGVLSGAAAITKDLAEGGFRPEALSSALTVTMVGLAVGLGAAFVEYFLDHTLRRLARNLLPALNRAAELHRPSNQNSTQ